MYRRFNQSYFYNNANQHKAEKKLITIVDRVPVQDPPENPIQNNSGYVPTTILPYSSTQKPFYEDTKYITYPEVVPNMYTINTKGEIFNRYGKLMSVHSSWGDDYLAVTLQTVNRGSVPFLLHRLVAYQFCNPPANFKNMIVNHIDGNKHNDSISNLEWITVAANNQHAVHFLKDKNSFVRNGYPIVNETFVRYLCEQFEAGKSNTEIMHGLKLTIDNANHTLFRDIRGGYTWTHITSQYNFARSSKKHAYTPEQKETIRQYILQGMNDFEVFKIMVGRDYVASTDRKDSSYRTIHTIREALRRKGHNV